MGTRDDEYDYLFKGNVLSEGGRVTAGSSSPSKLRRRRLEVRKSGEPAGMLKLALPASSEGGIEPTLKSLLEINAGVCVCAAGAVAAPAAPCVVLSRADLRLAEQSARGSGEQASGGVSLPTWWLLGLAKRSRPETTLSLPTAALCRPGQRRCSCRKSCGSPEACSLTC